MGRARRLHASATAVGLAVLVAALAAAGCGSSGSSGTKTGESTSASPASGQAPAGATARDCATSVRGVSEVRAAGMTCSVAAEVAAAWTAESGCNLTSQASRGACTAGRYRCFAASTDRGLAVSCSLPGRAISFLAQRG